MGPAKVVGLEGREGVINQEGLTCSLLRYFLEAKEIVQEIRHLPALRLLD